VSRGGTLWLLLAVVVTAAPLFRYLPPWVPLVPLLAVLWRLGIYRARWGVPPPAAKVVLILLCIGGLLASFKGLLGLEPMVAMLVCAFSLKLLEIHSRRDALVVIYLAYFVAITLALFSQSFLTGLYISTALVMVTAALAGIHQDDSAHQPWRPLLTAAAMVAQAAPLMVVFFLVMPRLGPLWSVPAPASAVTGMSDRLAIGDITSLGRSSALAFRASFDGQLPERQQLYWRGLTLSRFDGKTWEPFRWGYADGVVEWQGEVSAWWQREVELRGEPLQYQVTLERQNGNWLYSLGASKPLTRSTGITQDQTLVSLTPVTRRFQYQVKSWPEALLNPHQLSPARRAIELQLPPGGNPRTRDLARQWRSETPDPDALIARLLDYYRGSFYYTLSPPALGKDSVDDFLFTTQQGFCEHFAASFVLFMRAAGIPARLVVGYQGGELHPDEGYLTVRQYDAHAWGEVWLADRGWVLVDPTAAVAPERILGGLLGAMSLDEVFANSPLSMARFQNIHWLNRLRLQVEALEYNWARWVLGYDSVQLEVLARLLGKVDSVRIGAFLLAGAVIALLPVLLLSLRIRGRVKPDPADHHYLSFCRSLARAGCPRQPGETPRNFARRCAQRFPASAEAIHAITDAYEDLRYSGQGGDPAVLAVRVTRFRRQFRWRSPVLSS